MGLSAASAIKFGGPRKAAASKGVVTVQGFVVPPDAKCVDDIIPAGRAGPALRLSVAAEMRKMGRPIPVSLKPVLTPEEKEVQNKQKEIASYGGLLLWAIFVLNMLETFLNAQYNFWPELKHDWN